MRVLVVGAGGVGSAFVAIASKREAYHHITVADIDIVKAEASVAIATNTQGGRVVAAHIDATSEESVTALAREMQRRRDPQCLRPTVQPADLQRCVRRRLQLRRHGDEPVGAAPDPSVLEDRDPPRRRPVRRASDVEEPGPDGARRDGRGARLLRRRRAIRGRRAVQRDPRDRRARRRRPRGRRLRLRPDVLDLDHHRGVPQPARHLRA